MAGQAQPRRDPLVEETRRHRCPPPIPKPNTICPHGRRSVAGGVALRWSGGGWSRRNGSGARAPVWGHHDSPPIEGQQHREGYAGPAAPAHAQCLPRSETGPAEGHETDQRSRVGALSRFASPGVAQGQRGQIFRGHGSAPGGSGGACLSAASWPEPGGSRLGGRSLQALTRGGARRGKLGQCPCRRCS